MSYLRVFIDEHKATLDDKDPRDLIDLYLLEMKKNENNKHSSFNEENLSQILLDFFIAGTETTATMVRWSLIYLLHHAKIQENLHKEIDSVIGSKIPRMEDKKNMSYMAAFIEEIMRIAVVAPLAFEHSPSHDTTINGCFIPKNAVMVPNLHSAAFDPEVFKEPKKFCPERFLDTDGQFHAPEKSIPFSMGRRVCLGESLAKTEFFLFLTFLLQHFEFVESETRLPSFQGILGGTFAPLPFTIKALPRM